MAAHFRQHFTESITKQYYNTQCGLMAQQLCTDLHNVSELQSPQLQTSLKFNDNHIIA